jgi:hypothetical protein
MRERRCRHRQAIAHEVERSSWYRSDNETAGGTSFHVRGLQDELRLHAASGASKLGKATGIHELSEVQGTGSPRYGTPAAIALQTAVHP